MAKNSGSNSKSDNERRFRRNGGGVADWGTADAELIKAVIVAAAPMGGAVRFGYSRDGGAYAIGIYGDGEPYTEFVRPAESIDGFLRDLESLYLELGRDGKQV